MKGGRLSSPYSTGLLYKDPGLSQEILEHFFHKTDIILLGWISQENDLFNPVSFMGALEAPRLKPNWLSAP